MQSIINRNVIIWHHYYNWPKTQLRSAHPLIMVGVVNYKKYIGVYTFKWPKPLSKITWIANSGFQVYSVYTQIKGC